MQIERPILFSGHMVQAILEGRKTQTRRAVSEKRGLLAYIQRALSFGAPVLHRCPYGKPGDRLWVRESFCFEGSLEYSMHESQYPRDGRPTKPEEEFGGEGGSHGWLVPWYRATDGEPNIVPEGLEDSSDDRTRWKPSIHMPRWASRITLEVTEVRVQRLQDISEEDAKAEGVAKPYPCDHSRQSCAEIGCLGPTHKANFCDLWDSINGKRQGAAWADNPWVWVVSFKRAKP